MFEPKATASHLDSTLFGRDRRVGECLLLREERKSGLRGPISVFGPIADMRGDPAQMTAMITITITVGGIITIIITARTAITITKIAVIIITTTIITIATMTIDDVAFTESCCRRARCR